MPIIKFEGFETGSLVTIDVTQGANSDSGSTPAWGLGSTISLELSASRLSGTAPMGVLFAASAASLAPRVESPFHDIEGVWDFDDPGDFTALGNAPIWGSDRNVGYGPHGTHVFSDPGTYVVTYTAHDGETSSTASLTISVEDPDLVFAGSDTAVVSGAGDFTGKPAGASEHLTIASALAALSGKTRARLLLRRSESFTDPISIDETSGAGRKYAIGAFGTGARPLLDMSGSGQDGVKVEASPNTFDEIMVRDIEIIGTYDPTAASQPVKPSGAGINLQGVGNRKPLNAHKTVWDVDMSNLGAQGVACDGNSTTEPNRFLYLGNLRCIGWFDYGILAGDGGDWGISGCTFQQPTGTYNGQGKSTAPWWPDHGPFRLSRPLGDVVFSNCDYASFNDWSSSSSSRSMQPNVLWNSGTHADQVLVVDRMRTEGAGFEIFKGSGGGLGVTDNFVVVDRLFVIHTDLSRNTLRMPMGGTTVRNSILVAPNIPPGGAAGLQQMVAADVTPVVPGAQTRRSEFYSNALIDLREDANARSRGGNQDRDFRPGDIDEIAERFFGNNIGHAPNMVTGGTIAQGPLDEGARFAVLYDGERWEGAPVDLTRRYGTEVTARFEPQAGSGAIGGATGKVSLLDFDGNLRAQVLAGLMRATYSEGPFEPPLEG